MKSTQRTPGSLALLTRLASALVLICSFASARTPSGVLSREQKQKLTTTTVSDERFGKGGTIETTSDEKGRLMREVWKDDRGKVREDHKIYENIFHTWTFFDAEGKLVHSIKAARTSKGWLLHHTPASEKDRNEISFAQVERAVEQFEKDYAGQNPSGYVEQPTLPSHEVFKREDKSEKPESSTPSSPKEKPGSPADKPPIATGPGAAARAINPCLVGVWQSQSLAPFRKQYALSGIVLTIRADGKIAIEYKGMQPLPSLIGPEFTYSWAGTASGHVSNELNEFGFVTQEKGDVTETTTDHNTGEVKSRKFDAGFDPLGPASPSETANCDATTLRFTNNHGDFTFKRVGTAPR